MIMILDIFESISVQKDGRFGFSMCFPDYGMNKGATSYTQSQTAADKACLWKTEVYNRVLAESGISLAQSMRQNADDEIEHWSVVICVGSAPVGI